MYNNKFEVILLINNAQYIDWKLVFVISLRKFGIVLCSCFVVYILASIQIKFSIENDNF